MLDEVTTAVSTSGLITIYAGSQPAGGGAAGTQLAQLTCSATFADSAASGVLTFNSITADSNADATGTASWFRISTSGGTHVIDGDVSTVASGTGDMLLDDVAIILNGTVSLSGPNTLVAPNPS